jgi:hypothetical protein
MKPASITDTALAVANGSPKATGAPAALPPPDKSPPVAKAKDHNIRVCPAVLDAAGKDGDELLGSLRTSSEGLTVAFDFKWRRVSELFGVCFGIIWRTTRQFVPITRLSRAASTTSTETW